MSNSRRKALRGLTQEKVVNIGAYRDLRHGRLFRRIAFFTSDKNFLNLLPIELQKEAEFVFFDNHFSFEQALRTGEWDGLVLDERDLKEEVFVMCEKVKKVLKLEDLFIVVLSNNDSKDWVRQGYEKGCDEWITQLQDMNHFTKTIIHHLQN